MPQKEIVAAESPPKFLTLLTLIILANLLLHGYTFIPGYGESDAVRFGNDAILWERFDQLVIDPADYRFRVSPLYLKVLKEVLSLGLPASSLPVLMNGFNLFLSCLILVLLYVLGSRIFGPKASLISLALIVLQPGFWEMGMYGMPTLPAFVFFVSSLYFYDRHLCGNHTGHLLLASVSLLFCYSLKLDLVLCTPAFLGLCWLRNFALKNQFWRLFLVVVAPLILQLALVRAYTPKEALEALAFASTWTTTYPYTWRNFTIWNQVRFIFVTAGPLVLVSFLLALVPGLRHRERRRQAVFVLLWSLPPIIFWAGIFGNSMRHMVAGMLGWSFLIGTYLAGFPNKRAVLFTGLLIFCNYWSLADRGPHGLWPSTRVLWNAQATRQVSANLDISSREMLSRAPARAVFLDTWTLPYALNQALLRQRSNVEEASYDSRGVLTLKSSEPPSEWIGMYATRADGSQLEDLIRQGFQVLSLEGHASAP